MFGHPRMQLFVPIITVLCSTGALVVLAQEQCYEIDRLHPRLAVVLFVPVCEASALGFHCLDQGPEKPKLRSRQRM